MSPDPPTPAESLEQFPFDVSNHVVLTGYVGLKTHDFIHLYPALNQKVYFKVPTAKIVQWEHAVPLLKSGPVRIVVDQSAIIDFVQTLKITESFLTGSITSINLVGSVGDHHSQFGNRIHPTSVVFSAIRTPSSCEGNPQTCL